MKDNFLVFIPNDEAYFAIKEEKTNFFKKYNDESIYSLPPYLVFGKTNKNTFDRFKIKTNVTINTNLKYTNFGSIFPFPLIKEFYPLIDKYNIDLISGFYIGNIKDDKIIKIPTITSLTLALLKYTDDGYLLIQ